MNNTGPFNPQLFYSLLPGKTFLESCRITSKYGYKTQCALNDGVQRPNTFKNEIGSVYVEIRSQHVHQVLRVIPLLKPSLVENLKIEKKIDTTPIIKLQ